MSASQQQPEQWLVLAFWEQLDWLEFAWRDQEYRAAVRRLMDFCQQYRIPRPAPRPSLRYAR